MSEHRTEILDGPAGEGPRTPWLGGAGDGPPGGPPLRAGASCDVCVVGAGVSGLAVGLELAERGRDVVVLEARGVATGQTSRSSAHLVTALDERYFNLERRHGAGAARAAATAHGRAIAWIRRAAERHGIECGLEEVSGLLVVPAGREAGALLEAERAAAGRAGVSCERVAAGGLVPPAFVDGGLRFPGQAQVDPVRFVSGMAGAFVRAGGRLHCGTPVHGLRAGAGGVTLTTGGGVRVRARHVVLATHELPGFIAGRVRPMRPRTSFVIACEWSGDGGFLLWDGYWDGPEPYHYVRTARTGAEGLVVLVGGEDQEGAAPTDEAGAYERLERWTRGHLGAAGARRGAWWGRIQEPEGEFALIGGAPGVAGVSVVAGDSGNGMTYAAIAAVRLADQLDGFASPAVHERMFSPGAQ